MNTQAQMDEYTYTYVEMHGMRIKIHTQNVLSRKRKRDRGVYSA
jgi:hypothetical protein